MMVKKISNNFKLVTTGINRIIQFLGDHTGAEILNLSENSHFENIIFDIIHIFKVSFLTKFTFSKSQFSQKFTSNSWSFLDKKLVFAPVWIKNQEMINCGVGLKGHLEDK